MMSVEFQFIGHIFFSFRFDFHFLFAFSPLSMFFKVSLSHYPQG